MTAFDKFKFWFWDDLDATEGLIRRWEPAALRDEAAYEASLFEFLHTELRGLQITRQYGHDRFKADIVVERRVAIELKHNLISVAEYQRLLGQLDEYADSGMKLLLVLAGVVDRDLTQRVERHLNRRFNGFSSRGRLVIKGAFSAPQPAA